MDDLAEPYRERIEEAIGHLFGHYSPDERRPILRSLVSDVLATRPPLWTCPDCAFTFAREHMDEGGGHTCPVCAEGRLREENGRLRALLDEVIDKATRSLTARILTALVDAARAEGAKEEREACARVAEGALHTVNVPAHLRGHILTAVGVLIGAAIRSRGAEGSGGQG